MAPRKLADDLYILPGLVNVYLLDAPGGLTLIDTGFPRDTPKILAGIEALGRRPEDLRHILLTHAHPDHVGGAAALRARTGARVYAHGADAAIIEDGGPFRPIRPAPGLRNKLVVAMLGRLFTHASPAPVDGLMTEGVPLPFADDLVPVHVPGHCAGQVALHWRRGAGVMFVADACINRKGMVLAAAQEDVGEARRSLGKLAGSKFEIACFGHGPPIMSGADRLFRERWLSDRPDG